jgi:amidohydrolase
VIGAKNVLDFAPVTPSDDVSEFLNRVPGCYFFVGGALADGSSGMHHSPDFAIDDGACRIEAGVLVASAIDLASTDAV